jgi:hypothetical protein
MDDPPIKTLVQNVSDLSLLPHIDIASWLRMADFVLPSQCSAVNTSSSTNDTSTSTLTAYEKVLLCASSNIFYSGMPDLVAEYENILAFSSPDEVGNGIAKLDRRKNPEDSFPVWEPFALHCKIRSSKMNNHLTQVLICPALGGRFAVPLLQPARDEDRGKPSSDIDPSLWASADLMFMMRFCYCRGFKAKHFLLPCPATLEFWRNLMDHLTRKTSDSFCFAEIVGTLVLRRTIGLLLNVFSYCQSSDPLHNTHYCPQSLELFRKWGTALKTAVENPGGEWKKAMEETGYGPWLFEE